MFVRKETQVCRLKKKNHNLKNNLQNKTIPAMPVTKWVLNQEKDFQIVTMTKHCHLAEAIFSVENKMKFLKLTYINNFPDMP